MSKEMTNEKIPETDLSGQRNARLMIKDVEQKELYPLPGGIMAAAEGILLLVCVLAYVWAGLRLSAKDIPPALPAAAIVAATLGIILFCILLAGFRVVDPKEALVLVLFGRYYGTILKEGFYFVNPFCFGINPAAQKQMVVTGKMGSGVNTAGKCVSMKTMTLDNDKQKVNDELGNPIIIGAVVIWRIVNPTKAVFNVQNYKSYLSIQCDSIIRNVARMYPYDVVDEGDVDEKSLRGSSQEIADRMKGELQERVETAGILVEEVKITHLSYAPEIASAMLQRQQAVAVIAARQKIVEGAVGMVEMALNKLNEKDVVELDEERKAAMVSNLLVILCGNKEVQPIVNSGTIY